MKAEFSGSGFQDQEDKDRHNGPLAGKGNAAADPRLIIDASENRVQSMV